MASQDLEQSETTSSDSAAALARPLAPEDIRAGDYVARLYDVYEYAPFIWSCDDTFAPRDEPLRMRFVPTEESLPLKVVAVCLPFVLAKQPRRGQSTLDVRSCRLARLDPDYARQAWKEYDGGQRRKKGKSKKKRRRRN